MKDVDATQNNLRAQILLNTKDFLQSLDADAAVEELTAILSRIKEKEMELIKAEGAMIAPDLWRLLHRKLVNRIERDAPAPSTSLPE